MITQDDVPVAATSHAKPGIFRKVWGWCCRHPWLAVPGVLIGSLITVQVAYETWLLHGWRPDIVATGQIIDFDTRQPVAGVWVLIYIQAYAQLYSSDGHRRWYIPEGGGNGMLSPLSTVVQTDLEGRFSYRVSAYDAFQSAGYTKFFLGYGAYKYGYESVNPDTGKSSKGGEDYLTLEKPKLDQPWAFVRRVADTAEGRRASRDDFPVGIDLYAPSEVTWPQWSKLYHRVVSDELDHWCQPPTPTQEDRLLLSFVEITRLLRQQQSMLESWLRHKYGSDDRIPDSTASSRRVLDSYLQAAPDFPWPYPDFPTDPPTGAAVSLTFNAEQKKSLCTVLREQTDSTFHQSMTSWSLSR